MVVEGKRTREAKNWIVGEGSIIKCPQIDSLKDATREFPRCPEREVESQDYFRQSIYLRDQTIGFHIYLPHTITHWTINIKSLLFEHHLHHLSHMLDSSIRRRTIYYVTDRLRFSQMSSRGYTPSPSKWLEFIDEPPVTLGKRGWNKGSEEEEALLVE